MAEREKRASVENFSASASFVSWQRLPSLNHKGEREEAGRHLAAEVLLLQQKYIAQAEPSLWQMLDKADRVDADVTAALY